MSKPKGVSGVHVSKVSYVQVIQKPMSKWTYKAPSDPQYSRDPKANVQVILAPIGILPFIENYC